MPHLLVLGMGYTAARLAGRLRGEGWRVTGVRRHAASDILAFDDEPAVRAAIAGATHILSSVPPEGGVDPVLIRYGQAIAAAPALWTGYLSSTGVYGDAAGAWVDEASPVGQGRRTARAAADADWGALRPDMRRFRLPGIYGPGRSALDRVREGKAHRIALPDQVFSRVHVDDIVAGAIASFDGPPGVYNLADDLPCAQNDVIEAACDLLGRPWPPLQTMGEAALSPMARGFYAENRRVANGRAKRLLGWAPLYPTYRQGLRACL
ncbi:Rossmann-fold NAD(P)-binding domain-containing protein [Sphingomonas bisphenolicum]|uniref:NAD(P)-dependent oxidoreductase n=1 Tax=Sphingomonas bisphenolicum TaxID=296544 RepID=A0ABM7FY93_9SPHN|nr:SDR family NAD(P)-dependent oxidoreductase [Sphingomonas bisphenolicum]BBF68695.1 NAD(P)-dependent oxidoreductase [Sphingomonas bisphenolicum]